MASCRFCLFPQEADDDPLLSPCKCAGSIAWVHQNCLKKWFVISGPTNDSYICQLCKTNFNLPNNMKFENLPLIIHDGAWFYLSRWYMLIPLVYIIHGHVAIVYPFVFNTMNQQSFFLCLLAFYTSLYAAYYAPFVCKIYNKRRYFKYWTRSEIQTEDDYVYNPATLCVFTLANLAAIPFYGIAPFGALYMWSLPKFMKTHIAICKAMNREFA